MKKYLAPLMGGLLLIVLLVAVAWAAPSGRYFNPSGVLLVGVGTLAAAALAHSWRGVIDTLRDLPGKLKGRSPADPDDLELFLRIAEWHRLGRMRIAEQEIRKLRDPWLRQGTEMVIDRTPDDELIRMLYWKIGAQRERDQDEIKIVLTMAGFAPAFGMLGTLFGLIDMMYALDASQMEHIGTAMGFSLLTTLYGLVAANLILKPLAVRLEQRARERLAWLHVQAEVLRLLRERSHPALIRDYWQAFSERAVRVEVSDALALSTVKSSS